MIVSSSNRHKQKDNPKSRIKWHCWRREVEDGIVKSAILSGQTLVNLFNVDDSLSVELSNRRWKYQKRVLNLISGNKYYVYLFN